MTNNRKPAVTKPHKTPPFEKNHHEFKQLDPRNLHPPLANLPPLHTNVAIELYIKPTIVMRVRIHYGRPLFYWPIDSHCENGAITRPARQ